MNTEITVVVPTHNRPDGLATLLDGLEGQDIDAGRFEIVVVDDGSRPAAAAADRRLPLRVIRHDSPLGPAAARNRGWQAAVGPVVAFIDDDCVPAPGWLRAILEAAGSRGSEAIVQGPVAPRPDQAHELRPLSHTIVVDGPTPLYVSCNIAFSRTLLDRTGGFDESFKRACGEDVELGARATAAGAATVWAGGALVYHEVRQLDLPALLRQTMKWTDSVRVVGMHPELRRLLTWNLFWKPTHPMLLAAAAGIASRRPLLGAVAALPYLNHYRRIYGRAGAMARSLPTHVVVDAWEIGTAAVGSARHRTLML